MSQKDFEDHGTCSGCGRLLGNDLLKSGRCPTCTGNAIAKANAAISRADERAMANVARTILSSIATVGKGEPTSPAILEAAIDELGGVEKFGRMIGKQIKIATGEDVSGLPQSAQSRWKYSPQIAFKWSELLARLAVKTDERDSIDVGSLTQDELLSNLQPLMLDLIQMSPQYRAMMHAMIVSIEPQLASNSVDAVGVNTVHNEPTPDPSELDYDEAE